MVRDTLSQTIGETRETALVATYEHNGLSGSYYFFNGDQDVNGSNFLRNYGGRLSFVNDYITLGADYTSNLADSDNLQGKNYGLSSGLDTVSGKSIYGNITLGPAQLFVEHLKASGTLGVDGNNSQPEATRYEASFNSRGFNYSLSHQKTREALFLGLPETRNALGISTEVLDGLRLGLELAKDQDYTVADGGSGTTTRTANLRFSTEF